MATIRVDLDETEVRAACEYWATHRVLNEGQALSSDMSVTICEGKQTVTLNSVSVWVETDRMKPKT